MTIFYMCVHSTYENTNAVFLEFWKAEAYIDENVNNGIGTYDEWHIIKIKEGEAFHGDIHT